MYGWEIRGHCNVRGYPSYDEAVSAAKRHFGAPLNWCFPAVTLTWTGRNTLASVIGRTKTSYLVVALWLWTTGTAGPMISKHRPRNMATRSAVYRWQNSDVALRDE